MDLITEYLPAVLVVALIVSIISSILFLKTYGKCKRLNQHLEEMLSKEDEINLTGLVSKYLDTTLEQKSALTKLTRRVRKLENWQDTAVQNIALTRYNAFEGVGGDQSFSLVLLKGNGEGVLISGLYGRDESRVYAKPIENGESPYQLSDEEQEAVKEAYKGINAKKGR